MISFRQLWINTFWICLGPFLLCFYLPDIWILAVTVALTCIWLVGASLIFDRHKFPKEPTR